MADVWFTSDTHFYHQNIIRYCNRPFATYEDMNDCLLTNLNALVKPQDILYHLGDFCLGRKDLIGKIRKHIACNEIHLLLGNHDNMKYLNAAKNAFASIARIFIGRIHNQSITLHHYAQRVWHKSHHGAWHLFGHSHGNLSDHGKSFDVGVDAWNYKPVSFDEIRAKMDTLEPEYCDHHGRSTP